MDPNSIRVVSGAHNIRRSSGKEQISPVARIVRHPAFSMDTMVADIALIQLAQPVNLNGPGVGTTCLPPPGARYAGKAFVSGWGKTSERGYEQSDVLRVVDVSLVSDEACRNSYPTMFKEVSQRGCCITMNRCVI